MSTTMERIDASEQLNGWLQGVTKMYVSDIQAIPDDKWAANFGGCSRPPSTLTADAIGFLFWVTMAIKAGGTPTTPEGAIEQLEAACATKAGAVEMMEKASKGLSEALTGASDDTLIKKATAPWGMEDSLYSLAQMAVSHIWYHDGQLNYIQCLMGDADYHWHS